MCRLLQVSASGYYKWRSHTPSKRQVSDAMLKLVIVEVYESSRGAYGAPRVHAELRMGRGIRCSKKRVARLMRELELQGACRRKRFGCTRRNPKRASYPDLVDRKFSAESPNRLWVADITQHPTVQGLLYLAVVIDMFSRMVIGWSMSARQTVDLVLGAVNMAVRNRQPRTRITHHSDHGSQYTSMEYGRRLREAGIMGSMGSVGDALDNAVAESFFSSLQVELLDTRVWSSRDELRMAIFEYIEVFYNRKRRHSSLQYMTPVEYENQSSKQTLAASD